MKFRIVPVIVLILVLVAGLALTNGLAAEDACFIELEKTRDRPTDDLTLRHKRTMRSYNKIRNTLRRSARDYVREAGYPGTKLELFWIANAFWVEEPELCRATDELNLLMKRTGARIVSNVRIKFLSDREADPKATDSTEPLDAGPDDVTLHLEFLGIPRQAKIAPKDDPVVIGILDSAVGFKHPAIIRSYRGNTPDGFVHNRNWFDVVNKLEAPPEQNADWHGTAAASLAAGAMVSTDGTVVARFGAAIDSRWIACNGLEDQEYGNLKSVLSCLQWFLAPTTVNGKDPNPLYRPDIINLSADQPDNNEGEALLQRAIEALDRAGIVFVVSAGNSGADDLCQSITRAPQTLEAAITVGALEDYKTNGRITYQDDTCGGPVVTGMNCRIKPDVVAPGMSIDFERQPDGTNRKFSFTSAAAPQVAGLIALWMSKCSSLRGKPARIRQLLRDHAERVPLPTLPPFCKGTFCSSKANESSSDNCEDWNCTLCTCEGLEGPANGVYGWGYPRLDRLIVEGGCD